MYSLLRVRFMSKLILTAPSAYNLLSTARPWGHSLLCVGLRSNVISSRGPPMTVLSKIARRHFLTVIPLYYVFQNTVILFHFIPPFILLSILNCMKECNYFLSSQLA